MTYTLNTANKFIPGISQVIFLSKNAISDLLSTLFCFINRANNCLEQIIFQCEFI